MHTSHSYKNWFLNMFERTPSNAWPDMSRQSNISCGFWYHDKIYLQIRKKQVIIIFAAFLKSVCELLCEVLEHHVALLIWKNCLRNIFMKKNVGYLFISCLRPSFHQVFVQVFWLIFNTWFMETIWETGRAGLGQQEINKF